MWQYLTALFFGANREFPEVLPILHQRSVMGDDVRLPSVRCSIGWLFPGATISGFFVGGSRNFREAGSHDAMRSEVKREVENECSFFSSERRRIERDANEEG